MSTTVVERERVEEVVAPKKVTESDVLERAADLLEEFGWCQGKAGSKEEGEFCMFGALITAQDDVKGPHRGVYKATRCLDDLGGGNFIDWNDAPGRTKAEVVAALRAAAQKARGQ